MGIELFMCDHAAQMLSIFGIYTISSCLKSDAVSVVEGCFHELQCKNAQLLFR